MGTALSAVEEFKKRSGKSPIVLIVDDEPDLCELLKIEFTKMGMECVTALTGDKGLLRLEEIHKTSDKTCALIISDVRMPGNLDGPSWIALALDQGIAPTYFAFMSGYTDLSTEQAYDLGACQIFKKPFSLVEASTLMTQILDGSFETRTEKPADAPKEFKLPEAPLKAPKLSVGKSGFFCASEHLPKVGQWAPFHFEFEKMTKPIKGLSRVRWLRVAENAEGPRGFGAEVMWLDPECMAEWVEFQTREQPRAYIPLK